MASDFLRARVLPIVTGLLVLGVVVGLAVGLPRLYDEDGGSVDLPDELAGGWSAVDTVGPGGDDAAEYAETQATATEYVQDTYRDVYDAPVGFRAYADEERQRFVIATVFPGPGRAFGPPNGIADPEVIRTKRAPTELVREDDAVCVVNWEAVSADDDSQPEPETPLGVSCQAPAGERTVQVSTSQQSVDDTVELLHEVAEAVAS
ncbi:hypothetical protein [Nocardioides sp. SYSU D00038]|uniref:hypothetical protein n=1 Tax=Nocardioides sp. SYSU D00038 TaxID=2812554 RepID=UPI001967696A|nr:hypothetical protein [Nocardioides sp. SYSU D00038]